MKQSTFNALRLAVSSAALAACSSDPRVADQGRTDYAIGAAILEIYEEAEQAGGVIDQDEPPAEGLFRTPDEAFAAVQGSRAPVEG